MSNHTNDLMFEKLSQEYSELGLTTLGDLLGAFRDDVGQENRGSLQYDWYVGQLGGVPPERDTLADAAFRFWSTAGG